MVIRKHNFYEGAALSMLIRAAGAMHVIFQEPFFVVDGRLVLYLKYSTKVRSPWNFTFTAEEQILLTEPISPVAPTIALICGEDGVAALSMEDYESIVNVERNTAAHVACFRRHGEYYEISGPNGVLQTKIAPSKWHRLLNDGVEVS
jgi:hypothetical protein